MGVTGGPWGRMNGYIDGFNLYHGMMDEEWGHLRWLNHEAVIRGLVGGAGSVESVQYFTSHVREPDRLSRQRHYLEALKAHCGTKVHLGRFEKRKTKCSKCSKWFNRQQEKETDVRLATAIVADAFDNLYDTLMLVSADADLVPAIEYVKERFAKNMLLVDPPRRHSDDLLALSDHPRLRISEQLLAECQLPDPVERVKDGRVKRYYRPPLWTAPN